MDRFQRMLSISDLKRSVSDDTQHWDFLTSHITPSQVFQSLIPVATCCPHSIRPPTCRELERSGITRVQLFMMSPKDAWGKIPPQRCERLNSSDHKRLIAVVAAERGPAGY